MSWKILIIVLISFVPVSFRVATAQEEKMVRPLRSDLVAGRIVTVEVNSMTVRVGDATTTFSFDNKTVFTYGDQRVKLQDLKVGYEVLANVKKGIAAEVNGTERLEGIIERIDDVKKELIVKVGDQIKKIPFRYFLPFSSEGKSAAYTDMKVGDAILLNVNIGFDDQPAPATTKP